MWALCVTQGTSSLGAGQGRLSRFSRKESGTPRGGGLPWSGPRLRGPQAAGGGKAIPEEGESAFLGMGLHLSAPYRAAPLQPGRARQRAGWPGTEPGQDRARKPVDARPRGPQSCPLPRWWATAGRAHPPPWGRDPRQRGVWGGRAPGLPPWGLDRCRQVPLCSPTLDSDRVPGGAAPPLNLST